jgi:outer membrane protein TolC
MFRKLIPLLFAPVVLGAQQMTDTTLHPITIADAVRLAKDNNVANITANNGVRTATNGVRSARAQLYPTLTGTAGQSKSAGDRLGQSGNLVPFTGAWTYSTGLSSQMTLFDAGKMFADIKTQQANVTAAQAAEVNTDFNVGLQVKLAYNSILAAKESETAARAQLDAALAQ